MHDLVDLQLAMTVFAGDHADITHAATRLFAARKRHPWPPRVTARAGWEEGYREEAAGLTVVQSLDEALRWANDLISTIDAAQ